MQYLNSFNILDAVTEALQLPWRLYCKALRVSTIPDRQTSLFTPNQNHQGGRLVDCLQVVTEIICPVIVIQSGSRQIKHPPYYLMYILMLSGCPQQGATIEYLSGCTYLWAGLVGSYWCILVKECPLQMLLDNPKD